MSSPSPPSLQGLLQRPDLWRLQDRAHEHRSRGLATGYPRLDASLHGAGWPRAALTELLLDRHGIGELQLVLPALLAVSGQQLWHIWINPPFIPYAPALAAAGLAPESLLIVRTEPRQQLWACEQALRSAASGAVLFWPALPLRYAELRKLQVAAAAQQSVAFIFRGVSNAAHTSPAALRLQLTMVDQQLSIDVLKQRGGRSGQRVLLPRSAVLQMQSALWQRATLTSNDMAQPVEPTLAEPTPPRRIITPIGHRRPLPRTFSVRSDRRAVH